MRHKPVSRITQIDFLRGIAILLVMLEHGAIPPDKAGRFFKPALFFHYFGWTGVDLFFVLSGFLIGGLLFAELLRHGKLNVKRFIIRRGFKIWPLYYLYLIASTLSVVYVSHITLLQSFQRMLPQYLHIQNYFPPDYSQRVPLAHTWSLGIEEHFYLFLPFILLLLTHRRLPKSLPALPYIGLAVMLGCLILRLRLPLAWASETHLQPTQIRIDSLFAGVLLAYFWHYHPARLRPLLKRPGVLLACGLLLVSPMFKHFLKEPFVWRWGFTLLYLGYGCILLALMATTREEGASSLLTPFFRTRLARAIAFIGFYSYPIYLFHIVAIVLVYPWTYPITSLTLCWFANNALNVLLGILFGVVMGRLVEVPTLALRDRLFPNEAGREESAPAVNGGNAVTAR